MNSKIIWTIIVLLVIVSCSTSTKTQSANSKLQDQSANARPVNQDSLDLLEREKILKYGSEEEKMRYLEDEEDIYLKYEYRFKAMMINEKIPASFPSYESDMSEQSYMEKVNAWKMANQEMLKPEYRN